MLRWLVGSLILLTPCLTWAQEKSCQVEATQLTIVKQTRDAYERRVAELAVQTQQLQKEKQSLERRLAAAEALPESKDKDPQP